MNIKRHFRTRKPFQLAATFAVVAAVSLLSSAGVRGAVRDTPVSAWVPTLAKLALLPVTSFMQGPVAGQGDGRTVPGAQAKPGAPSQPATGDAMVSLLVKTAAGLSEEGVDALMTRHGAQRGRGIGALRLHVIRVPQAAVEGVMHRFEADPEVEHVEVEQRRQIAQDAVPAAVPPAPPSDSAHADQWALEQIRWNAAWSSVTPTGSARIAVLDTGVSAAEGDINVGAGWSAFGTDPGADANGHGTWVASIAAAVGNNSKGVAGVSFANTTVLPVQVLDANGQGQDSDIISGVLWAVENRADVILMAFSNPGYSQSLQDAIDLAWSNGIVIVAAAGNEASSTPTFPAGDSKVVGVAATDQTDALWSQSNFGKGAFLAAPGVAVSGLRADGSVLSTSGTSASSAVVAGAAALLKVANPSLTNGVIVGRLARNADAAGTQEQTGNGRLNVERALADTSLEAVVPVGAPPEGDGGPFVGPYRIAAKTLQIIFSGNGSGTVAWTGLLDNGNPVNGTCASGGAACVPRVGNTSTGTLTASVGAGSTFAGWSGASALSGTCATNSTASPCAYALSNSDGTITVTFNGTGPTTTSISSSPNPSVFGQPVTFTATVAANSGSSAPTGSVSFSVDGGAPQPGTAIPPSGNAATFTYVSSNLSVGPHSVVATYSATGVFSNSTSNAGSHTVAKADTTTSIGSISPSPATFGQPATVNFAVAAATPGSGAPTGTVKIFNGTIEVCSGSLSGGSGTCTFSPTAAVAQALTATYQGDASFNTSTSGSTSLTINKSAQAAVTVSAPGSGTYRQAGLSAVAAAGSGTGAYSYSHGASTACTVDATTGLISVTSGTGTCSITASRAGDSNYDASAPSAPATVTVSKATQTITFAQPTTPATYGSTFPVAATVDSTLSVTLAASGACSISGGMVTMTSGTGDCTLTASQAGDGNYGAATDVVRTVAAAKKAQTITFAAPASSATYQSTFDVAPTASTGLFVTVAATGACSISGSTVTMTSGSGSCTLTASQAGNDNYSAAADVVHTVFAAKAKATMVVTPYSVTFDGQAHTATGTATGVGGADLSSLLNLTATTHTNAGTYASDGWTFAGDSNYEADSGTVSNVISKADATVSVTGYTGVYDGVAHGATGTATGVGNAALSGLVLGAKFTNVPGGTANWTFTDATGNYNNASGSVAIVINKADATINVNGYTGVFDGAEHGATGTATGVGNAALSGLVLGAKFTNVPGGTANWTFTDTTGNYNNASGSVAIVINKADATISVNGYTGVFDGAAHGATGTATGVGNAALSGLVLGAKFTNVPGGTANWTFTDTTGNYNNASGSVAIVINKADATISVNGYTGVFDGAAHGATGTALGVGGVLLPGLNLGATYSNVPGGTASWTFTDMTGNYNNASGSVQITITPAQGTIALSNLVQAYSGSGLQPLSATSPSGFPVAFRYYQDLVETGSGGSVVAVGVYRVVATSNTPNYVASAEDIFVIYDPTGGFVTGGGWIQSPSGACALTTECKALTGRANFGFVSKYERGAKVPTGQTQFQFQAGGLNFHSTTYEWLVVSGARAQYKGTGTINGIAGYQFLLTIVDGQLTGGLGADSFRIKITQNGLTVYDNQMGDADDAALSASTVLASGSVVIHQPPAGKK